MSRDYYEVLGVGRSASEAEIKKAFRALARSLHPDVNRHDPNAEEQFKEAAEAYEVLSDAKRRAVYDRYGQEGLRSGGFAPNFGDFSSLSDIFETFFGGGDPFGSVFRDRRSGPAPGDDIATTVEVSLEEVVHGATRELDFDALVRCRTCHGNGAEPGTPIVTCPVCGGAGELQAVARTAFGQLVRSRICESCGGDGRIAEQPCEDCAGKGRALESRSLSVDVPAGIADAQRIRLSGQGHAGPNGGPNGDLYVFVNVLPDERFERHGEDLATRLDVAFTDAALGATVAVATLDGERELRLDPGTQPSTVMRLRGLGLPSLRGRRRGDLHVVVNVMVPRNLSEEQRELLRRFAASANGGNYEVEEETESLLDRIRQALGG
jgi:molecular chaperone DnaJ